MKDVSWILIICATVSYLQTSSAELKLLQVVFKHGNTYPRSSCELYPSDPYLNKTYKSAGIGDLTNDGKSSMYQFGGFLRKRYDTFLGQSYSDKMARFYAKKSNPIVMSAELVATGMFPVKASQRWHPKLSLQRVPVRTKPFNEDTLYNGRYCENHKKLRAKVEKTDRYILKRKYVYEEFYEYMTKHVGANVTQKECLYLYDILQTQKNVGLELPTWTESVFPYGPLKDVAAFDFYIQSYNRKLQQLMGGMWLREWLNHVDECINNTSSSKAHVYAAMGENIASILIALRNFNNRIPSCGSAVMFELHDVDKKLYVKVLQKENGFIRTLNIPRCGDRMCPLNTFKRVFATILPDNQQTLCGNIDHSLT